MKQGGVECVYVCVNLSSHVSRWLQPWTALWQGKREQMPLHWGVTGHQIGNITDHVPIQLQATNWCITEPVLCVRDWVCPWVRMYASVSKVCVCYVCAGMRSWCVSVPGLRGKEDDPAQLTVSHAGQNNTITLLLTRTWHSSHLLPPEPHTGRHMLAHEQTYLKKKKKHSHMHTHTLFL